MERGLRVMNDRRMPRFRRTVAVGLLALSLIGVVAMSAGAHVHSSPEQVKSGATATVNFIIGHGCGTSPTTLVEIKVPSTVTKVTGVAPKGWTVSVKNSVVTFTGGTLADKTKGSFGVAFTAPKKTGTLVFPTVQTCVKGKNPWIDAPLANGKEPENPAPIVVVSNTPAAPAKKK